MFNNLYILIVTGGESGLLSAHCDPTTVTFRRMSPPVTLSSKTLAMSKLVDVASLAHWQPQKLMKPPSRQKLRKKNPGLTATQVSRPNRGRLFEELRSASEMTYIVSSGALKLYSLTRGITVLPTAFKKQDRNQQCEMDRKHTLIALLAWCLHRSHYLKKSPAKPAWPQYLRRTCRCRWLDRRFSHGT